MAKVKRFMQWFISDDVWQAIILLGMVFNFFTGRWLHVLYFAMLGIVVTLIEINRNIKNRKACITINIPDGKDERLELHRSKTT